MTKTTTFFTVDFFNNTINGSVANFKKASLGCGEAYEELVRLMNTHPTFTLNKIAPKKHISRDKKTYEGLTMDFIKDYLSIQENANDLLKEMDAVIKVAKNSETKVYPFVKKWFLDKFKNFDMKVAKEEVENSKYADKMAEVAEIINIPTVAEEKISA